MERLRKGRIFGMVTVGERGQVVIPAQLRRLFKVNSGDKLIVFAKPHMFGFIAADKFNRFVSELSRLAKKINRTRAKR